MENIWDIFYLHFSNNKVNKKEKYCIKSAEELRHCVCSFFGVDMRSYANVEANTLSVNEKKILSAKVDVLQFCESSAFLILFYFLRCCNNRDDELTTKSNDNNADIDYLKLCKYDNCLDFKTENVLKRFSIDEWLNKIQIFTEYRQSTKILDSDVYQV